MKRWTTFLLAAICALAQTQKAPKPRDIKPGFNLFNKQQDVQMGREYAAQVERHMVVIQEPSLNSFVRSIGEKLARVPLADQYPYSFKVVQDKSINAFALPGGPTFTHTGLISAADNEAQIAAVLAHEISHVALRHGTNQASKANLIQLPAIIGGELLGARGGLTGALAQLGIGLGANSVLLKMSRNAERDADLMGTRIMHAAGYNPIEMARFFEKLEAQHGKGGALVAFFSDHPNPEDRVKNVQNEILMLSQRSYDADSGQISRMKQVIEGLPAARPRQPQQGAVMQPGAGDPRNIGAARPSNRLRTYNGRDVAFSYPDNWQPTGNQDGHEVTIASQAGVVGAAIGYGLIAGVANIAANNLQQATNQMIQTLQQRDPNLRAQGNSRGFRLASGANAMATRLGSPSPFQGTNEADILITVAKPAGGLFYMILIAPDQDLTYAQPVFDQIIDSIRVN